MKFLVKCVRSKLGGENKWSLRGGELYEAEQKGERVVITNHYNENVDLSLKEFNYRCEIVKKMN